jgi:hypothetical protein
MSGLTIVVDDDQVTIKCDRRFGTVLIEGARRDLNAMSQAFGLAPELRNQYSRFAAELTTASKAIPRVNLFAPEAKSEAHPVVVAATPIDNSIEDLLG